jgi:hypothetical protein
VFVPHLLVALLPVTSSIISHPSVLSLIHGVYFTSGLLDMHSMSHGVHRAGRSALALPVRSASIQFASSSCQSASDHSTGLPRQSIAYVSTSTAFDNHYPCRCHCHCRCRCSIGMVLKSLQIDIFWICQNNKLRRPRSKASTASSVLHASVYRLSLSLCICAMPLASY